jgi:hypothetical protein
MLFQFQIGWYLKKKMVKTHNFFFFFYFFKACKAKYGLGLQFDADCPSSQAPRTIGFSLTFLNYTIGSSMSTISFLVMGTRPAIYRFWATLLELVVYREWQQLWDLVTQAKKRRDTNMARNIAHITARSSMLIELHQITSEALITPDHPTMNQISPPSTTPPIELTQPYCQLTTNTTPANQATNLSLSTN